MRGHLWTPWLRTAAGPSASGPRAVPARSGSARWGAWPILTPCGFPPAATGDRSRFAATMKRCAPDAVVARRRGRQMHALRGQCAPTIKTGL